MDTSNIEPKNLVPRKTRKPKYATEEERIQANKNNVKKYREKNKEKFREKNKEYYIKTHYLNNDNKEYHYNTKYYQEFVMNKDGIC